MTDIDRTPERSTDPRPRYILLGIDTTGAHHLYHTRRERIIVIAETERSYVQLLNGRPVSEWMAYVDDRRGWSDRRMYPDASSAIVDQIAQVSGA